MSRARGYGLAVLAPLVAWALLLLSEGYITQRFLFFYPAVAVPALLGGAGPGILATALSTVLGYYWVLPPAGHAKPLGGVEVRSLLFFAAANLAITLIAVYYSRKRDRLAKLELKAALIARDSDFSKYLDTSLDGFCLVSAQGRLLGVNDAYCKMVGYSREELLRMGIGDLEAAEKPEVTEAWMQAIRERGFDRFETRHRRKDGSEITLSASVRVVDGADGRMVASFQDVTERKSGEAALRKAQRTLEMITQCNEAILRARTEEELFTDVCKVIVDVGGYRMCWVGLAENDERKSVRPVAHAGHEDGYLGLIDIVWADEPRGRGTTGRAIREKRMVVGQDFSTDPSMRVWREEAHRRGYRSVTSLPLLFEGTVLGAIVMYSPQIAAFTEDELRFLQKFTDDVAFGVSAIRQRAARDRAVAERERAEAGLRESERWLRQSQEIARIGHFVIDVRGNRVTTSPMLEVILGLDEGFPRAIGDWTQFVQPEDHALVEKCLGELLEGRGNRVEFEFRVSSGSTGQVRWAQCVAEAERSPGGEPVRVVGTVQDVTERMAAEEGRLALQRQLAASARLASMGTLVAGVAHEINNPLSVLTISTGTVVEDLRSFQAALRGSPDLDRERLLARAGEAIEVLSEAGESAARIARIVKDLTILGKPDKAHKRLNLAELVQGLPMWLPPAVKSRATVSKETTTVPDVMASASQLEQVLVNLVTNAALAIPEGRLGNVVVRVGPAGQGRVFVEVSDDGAGIPPELRERIFEPFFTTRRQGKGTGLGLSICNAIVNAHGGSLTVQSEPGKGATFRVELPAAPAEA